MKVVELREKTVDELLVLADELRASIHQTQMDLMMKKSQNNCDIRKARKDLARVMTVLGEKRNA